MDGDDWLDDDWLERAIQEIEIHQADIFAGGLYVIMIVFTFVL